MVNVAHIKPGAKIVGSDDVLLGTVREVEGAERIRLQRSNASDEEPDDYISIAWVANLMGDTLRLDRPATDAHQSLNDEIPAGDRTS